MLFWQSLSIALDMLRLHKMRAFLTMLGVIIGVMAVSLVVLVSGAFDEYLQSEFSRIGSDTIFVSFDPSRLERGKSIGSTSELTNDDIKFIRDHTGDSIEVASGFREMGSKSVKFGETEVKDVSTRAIDENFVTMNRIELLRGRYFTEQDSKMRSSVCMISDPVAKKLFPNTDPLGKTIQITGLTMEVVGITKELELMGQRRTEMLFIPLATANSKILGDNRIDLILMRAGKGKDLNKVMDRIWEALMAKSGNRELYSVESSQNVLNVFRRIVATIGTVLSSIAALSLLVGGIGIMNIMLVSVTERTREIGLRKALGAPRPAILFQFLVESATLSLVGGMIGMLIAYLLGLGVTALTATVNWPKEGGLSAPFPFTTAAVAAVISGLIGVIFGLYPAARASSLDPIVALRTD